jgi:hypothetical protein
LFAAGVRLLPSREIERAPLFGKRELLAIAGLVAGSFCAPVILAMPLLILLSDMAYAPTAGSAVLRRTGKLFFVHALCVTPAALFLNTVGPPLFVRRIRDPFVYEYIGGSPELGFGLAATIGVAVIGGGLLVLIRRKGIAKTLVTAAVFALAWTATAELPRYLFESPAFFRHSILSLFGFALLIPTILWRIAIALTQPPRLELAAEPPLPSVPALRDLARGATVAGVPPLRRVDSAIGLRTTVETAVAGAVAASLEQIRLAFRGAQPSEPPGTPVQVLWNRLITGTSGGAAAEEKPDVAIARWNVTFDKEMKHRLKAKGSALCLGATPWPLVLAIAKVERAVVLVERGAEPARRASQDLAAAANVSVVRHDRGLDSVKDGAFDAVLCVIEPAMQTSAGLLALLRECRRVLRPGGVVGFGHADLALPESQQELSKGSSSQSFVNRQTIETLARLAGFGQFEYSAGVLPTTSIAWLKPPKAAA